MATDAEQPTDDELREQGAQFLLPWQCSVIGLGTVTDEQGSHRRWYRCIRQTDMHTGRVHWDSSGKRWGDDGDADNPPAL